MPRRDSNVRLRAVVRAAIPVWIAEGMRRQNFTPTINDLTALPKVVDTIVAALTPKQLRDLAEVARRYKIPGPRTQRQMSNEDGDLFIWVSGRMRKGYSERKACHDEGIARGCEKADEIDVFRMNYRRIKGRVGSILKMVGFDVEQLCKPRP